MNLIHLTLIVILSAAFFSTVTSLKCYVCDSRSNRNCSDPFKGNVTVASISSSQNGRPALCYKVTYKDPRGGYIDRGFTYNSTYCKNATNKTKNSTCKQCSKDLCNQGYTSVPTMMLAVFSVIVVISHF